MSLRFANDMEYLSDLYTDTFLGGFLSELYNRPSCYQCAFRGDKSGSDITLGDYWRVNEKFPQLDDDKGTSLALAQTEKGDAFFRAIASEIDFLSSDYADATRTNPALIRNPVMHSKRAAFFSRIRKGKDFDKTVCRLLKRTLWRRWGSCVKGILRKVFG